MVLCVKVIIVENKKNSRHLPAIVQFKHVYYFTIIKEVTAMAVNHYIGPASDLLHITTSKSVNVK